VKVKVLVIAVLATLAAAASAQSSATLFGSIDANIGRYKGANTGVNARDGSSVKTQVACRRVISDFVVGKISEAVCRRRSNSQASFETTRASTVALMLWGLL
jgi:hypothetical protein